MMFGAVIQLWSMQNSLSYWDPHSLNFVTKELLLLISRLCLSTVLALSVCVCAHTDILNRGKGLA